MADVKVESIGTVKTVVGIVKAVDQSGAERILQAGDKVYANETIVTAEGGLVLVEFADGSHLDLASASKAVLDLDIFNPANANPKGDELTAEQIQEVIARGEDPTAVTEATAAGAGSGDEGGSSFIDVAFSNAKGHVSNGLQTQGIPGPDSVTFTEQPPVEDEAIVVAALADESSSDETTGGTVTEETSTEGSGDGENNVKIHANNGFGNGDQDAPGNSGPHNNAENAIDDEEGDKNNGSDNGNNGFGNGDQDAPGESGPHNNAENAADEDEGDDVDHGSDNGNNGFGNGDQDAPGESGPNNNAENAADNEESSESHGSEHGNNGFGNGDQDAPGNSAPNNNAENAADDNSGVTLTGKGNSNDILVGGDGDDTLIGGGGDDTMTGGAGADQFVWESGDLKKTDNGDTITDFNVSEGDTLNFDDLLTSSGGTLGLVEENGNTTVTLTTTSGTTVDLVTLTGVTGETLNTLLGTTTTE